MSAGKVWIFFSPWSTEIIWLLLYPVLPAIFSECCHCSRGSELGFVLLTHIKGVYDSLTHYSQSVCPLSPSCHSFMLLVHILSSSPKSFAEPLLSRHGTLRVCLALLIPGTTFCSKMPLV